MTRATVRAQQANEDDPGARFVRVTVTAVQAATVTVQLPGGGSTAAPRIAGAVYTVGGTAYVPIQEPGVYPALPIGNDAATPVGKYCKTAYASTLTVPSSTSTQIPLNIVANDDSSYYTAAGNGIQVLRAGLYFASYYALVNCPSSFSIFPMVNGSTKQETGAPSGARVSGTVILRLAVNDIVTLNTFASSAASVVGTSDPKDVGLTVAFQGS